MAHSTIVADQLVEFLQLINDPTKSKKFLDELKAVSAEIKTRQGLLAQKEDLESFALKVKKENSDTLAEIAKKQKKCDQDSAALDVSEKAHKASVEKWQKQSSEFLATREAFEKMKVAWAAEMEKQKEQLAIQEAELTRMVKYNTGLTKTLEEKQEALKSLLR